MPDYLLESRPGALTLRRMSWSGRLNLLASSVVVLSFSFLPFTFAQSPPSCNFAECVRADRMADANSYPRARLPAKYDLSRIGQRGIGRGLNFYSPEREKKLGDEIAKRMEPSLTIIDDPFIYGYLNRIAQAIVAHSEVSYNVRIKLLYDNFEINARSLPGGHLYMPTSLLLSLQNESETAMIITRETLWDLPFFPLLRLPGPIGYSAQQVTSALRSLPVLKFNRDTEREADLLGLEYAYSAGYDPQGILDMYERLALE